MQRPASSWATLGIHPREGRLPESISLASWRAAQASPRSEPQRRPPRQHRGNRQRLRGGTGSGIALVDEVLNFVNRHRDWAESFHASIQNLTVAVTGAAGAAAVISRPRSQVKVTDWDRHWQDRITTVVRCIARDLVANDEAETGDVVRRHLLEDLGDERIRRRVS